MSPKNEAGTVSNQFAKIYFLKATVFALKITKYLGEKKLSYIQCIGQASTVTTFSDTL